MIKYNQQGTALLVVVFVTTILITGSFMLWKTVALSYEGAMWHYRAKRQFYATESLALYGIALLKSRLILEEKLSEAKLVTIYRGNWPKQKQTWGELQISCDHKNKIFKLMANLFGNDHIRPISVTQVICKKNDKNLTILSWVNI